MDEAHIQYHRTAQLLFRLPRGSTPQSIREGVVFLKLACLHLV